MNSRFGEIRCAFSEGAAALILAARLDFYRLLLAGLAPLVLGQLAAATAAAQVTSPEFPGVTCEEVQVPMRDGTLLTTDVYLPSAPGRYPVVMQRDPYGRAFGNGCFAGLSAGVAPFVQQGYVGIDQQVRGTYTSQGSFTPVFQEAKDGYDAIEWAGVQPWSTGKVGMTSGSYLGIVQWQAAPLRPPHLAAIAPSVMDSDYHDGVFYVNGVFSLWLNQSWPAGYIVPDQMFRAGQSSAQVDAWNTLVNENLFTNWVWQLPLSGFSEFHQFASFYYDWVAHPNYDAYWAKIDTSIRYPDITVPALVSGDWYDPFQVGTVQNFQGMRSVGGSARARKGSRLVMGAYGHSGDSGTPTFGDDTPDPSIQMRFYDHYLKGLDNGFESDPIVHLYVLVPPNSGITGSGFWITGDDFPLPGTQIANYFLHSGRHANTRLGDGVLTGDEDRHDPRYRAAADRFDYDPENPAPTVGGNMCCNGARVRSTSRRSSSGTTS
jgi:putative CocE/NonD family hydrolase